ncbi:hypothetical protein TNCV_1891551 [Trichonephila clavipes]|nr:hypothetical protein TNCV_1891551 [Trichonephila clavipes]
MLASVIANAELVVKLDDWFLGVWAVTQSSIPCLDRFDVGLGEGGVFHFALWYGGDWLVDEIWEAWQTCFIRMGDVQSFWHG